MHERIREKVGVTVIQWKVIVMYLRWFGHVLEEDRLK